jgi:hypothetical protein
VVCMVAGSSAPACSFKVTVNCTPAGSNTIVGPRPLSLTWNGDAILESADDLDGPWTTVPAATPPFTPAPTGSRQFFRLRQPASVLPATPARPELRFAE